MQSCRSLLSHTTEKFSDTTGKSYNVRYEVTCKSTNVVYAVHCERCKTFVYVGETGDTLHQRHLLNLSRIRTRHNDPVAEHFYTNGHSVAGFRVMGLEQLNGTDEYRKTIEQLWKRKLRTFKPYGLNTKV
ncbi:hypothetical protein DPMN_007022 [Dreissena polymorpha]|uniref:GIY-YIG domain-containing protein n=1 Tax=Dreissena polymorpha TaxID=45954 RepID=A0A9D4MWK7_DREPO|nr:hypothetical protein DPMN_007022 [Dreissena polymorpha]